MVFEYAVIKRYRGVLGRLSVVIGTYTNGAGDSGGPIDCGLTHVHFFWMQPGGGVVITGSPSINKSFAKPIPGDAMLVVNTLNEDGHWIAVGTP